MERENLFLPAGFDTPTLINELSKGQILGQAGETLLYEDVIKKPTQAQGASRMMMHRQLNQFVECADWNTALLQRAQGKKSEKSSQPLPQVPAQVDKPSASSTLPQTQGAEPLKPPTTTPRGTHRNSMSIGGNITPREGG